MHDERGYGLDIEDLAEGRVPAEVTYAGHTLSFHFNPNQYDDLLQARVNKFTALADDHPDKLGHVVAMLDALLVGWDVYTTRGGERQKLPISPENIRRLALPLRARMLSRIQEVCFPPDEGPKASSSSDASPEPSSGASAPRAGGSFVDPLELSERRRRAS